MSWEDHPEYGGPKPSWREVAIFVLIILVLVGLWGIGAKAQSYKGAIPTNDDRYVYKALVERVIDGDTVVLEISLGFNIRRHREHVRLARINSAEKTGPTKKQGYEAKHWLEKKNLGKVIIIKTIKTKKNMDKKGSFGRYLVELFFEDENINDALVKAGHAVYRK